ncbi:MAG: excisionase [Firmicutes bacterium]|nr:excisionase [Bacillota bacterium]
MFEQYSDLVSVEELCEMLVIGKNSAYKLLSSGEIKCFRYNRVWKIPRDAVTEYILKKSSLNTNYVSVVDI